MLMAMQFLKDFVVFSEDQLGYLNPFLDRSIKHLMQEDFSADNSACGFFAKVGAQTQQPQRVLVSR